MEETYNGLITGGRKVLGTMRYLNWDKIKKCTVEERNHLISYIESLLELKYKFESQGIEAFDEYMNSGADLFETYALQLIMQGYMPEVCEKVLFNLLHASEYDDITYLKNLIFTEYVLKIQTGELGDLEMRIVLSSYLGIDLFDIGSSNA